MPEYTRGQVETLAEVFAHKRDGIAAAAHSEILGALRAYAATLPETPKPKTLGERCAERLLSAPQDDGWQWTSGAKAKLAAIIDEEAAKRRPLNVHVRYPASTDVHPGDRMTGPGGQEGVAAEPMTFDHPTVAGVDMPKFTLSPDPVRAEAERRRAKSEANQ